jgi:hypothetical protein
MKGIRLLATIAVLVGGLYFIGRYFLKGTEEAVSGATVTDRPPKQIVPASPVAQWIYQEQVDPITKKTITRAAGQLHTKSSTNEPVIVNVAWDCPDGTTESLKVEIVTFLDEKDDKGKLIPLAQDDSHSIDYRFDGVASTISSADAFSNIVLKREFQNSVYLFLVRKTGVYGRYRYPKLYIAAGKDADGDFMYDTKAFYVVDPEFAARVPTTNGAVLIQFSLEEPPIKKMLFQCGLTYGKPPPTRSLSPKKAVG